MQVGKCSAMKKYNAAYNSLTLAPQCTAFPSSILLCIAFINDLVHSDWSVAFNWYLNLFSM